MMEKKFEKRSNNRGTKKIEGKPFNKKQSSDGKRPFRRKEQPETTIYVGNLSYKRDQYGIMKLFKEYGYVKSVNIVTKPGSEESKGIAFVKMHAADAGTAIIKLNGKVVDGRTLKVSEAIPYEQKENKEVKFVDDDDPSTDGWEEESPKKKKKVRKEPRKGLSVLFNFKNKK